MRASAALAALVLAPALLMAPCAASDEAPQTGNLPQGGSYVLAPDPGVGAAAVTLWFRAPSAGYDDATPGLARVAATAAAVAPLVSGKTLVAFIHSVGGTLQINAYPDIISIDAVVPSSVARRTVAAMTAAYFAPSLDGAALTAARRDTAVIGVEQRYSANLTLHNLLLETMFSSGPAHYPPVPTSVASIAKITSAQVSAFAKRAFRSGNAVLALAGNIDPMSLSAVTDGSGASRMDAPFDSQLSGATGATDAPASIDGIGIGWVGPPITDERASTAMDFIADYLFHDGSGVVTQALTKQLGDTYAVGQFITLHDPGVMLVTLDGSGLAAAKTLVLQAVAKLATPLDATTFDAAREAFLYHLAADTQTPAQQADNLGWYAVEGNPSYAPGDVDGTYARMARSLDPQYVAQIVRRYLHAPVVVTLTPSHKESSAT